MTIPRHTVLTRSLSVVFLLFVSISSFSQSYTWFSLPHFIGIERDDAVAFGIDNAIYIGTGNHGGFAESNSFYTCDIETGAWRQIASFPGSARQYGAIEVVDDKAFLIGGIDLYNNPLNDCWSYDPLTDSWVQLASLPASPRWQACSFVIDELIYYGTGRNWDFFYNDFWSYNPKNDEWRQLESLPQNPSYERVSFSIGLKGYIGLGRDCTGVFIPNFTRYNPAMDDWEELADFPGSPRYYASAERIGSEAVVCAGQNESGIMLSDCWLYAPLESKWIQLDNMPGLAKRGLASCSLPFYGAFFCTGLDENFERLSTVNVIKNIGAFNEFNRLFYSCLDDFIHIDGLSEFSTISVYSITGVLMYDGRAADQFLEISTYNWSPGVYLVSINQNTKKVVVN